MGGLKITSIDHYRDQVDRVFAKNTVLASLLWCIISGGMWRFLVVLEPLHRGDFNTPFCGLDCHPIHPMRSKASDSALACSILLNALSQMIP